MTHSFDKFEAIWKETLARLRPRLPRISQRRAKYLQDRAKAVVVTCVRNTILEDYHAGIFPSSKTGDYSDVKVVSPYGEIPWNNLGRISDEEMKALMIAIVNNVYTLLRCDDADIPILLRRAPPNWYKPRLNRKMICTMEMLEGATRASTARDDAIDTPKIREAILSLLRQNPEGLLESEIESRIPGVEPVILTRMHYDKLVDTKQMPDGRWGFVAVTQPDEQHNGTNESKFE